MIKNFIRKAKSIRTSVLKSLTVTIKTPFIDFSFAPMRIKQ